MLIKNVNTTFTLGVPPCPGAPYSISCPPPPPGGGGSGGGSGSGGGVTHCVIVCLPAGNSGDGTGGGYTNNCFTTCT